MPDEVDIAQVLIDKRNADALAAHLRRQSPETATSRTHCQDCGKEIPEARRRAVNGCRRCIGCQEILENWSSL